MHFLKSTLVLKKFHSMSLEWKWQDYSKWYEHIFIPPFPPTITETIHKMWSWKQALFFKSWRALWIWFNQPTGAAGKAGKVRKEKHPLCLLKFQSKPNENKPWRTSIPKQAWERFWRRLLSGDFPQTNDLTFLVRQREMINMLIEGASVQVLKGEIATCVSVINTIRIAETT